MNEEEKLTAEEVIAAGEEVHTIKDVTPVQQPIDDGVAKTFEEHVLRELDAAKKQAEACENTIAALQAIFVVKYNSTNGDFAIELRKGALSDENEELARQNMGLLIGLFGEDQADAEPKVDGTEDTSDKK